MINIAFSFSSVTNISSSQAKSALPNVVSFVKTKYCSTQVTMRIIWKYEQTINIQTYKRSICQKVSGYCSAGQLVGWYFPEYTVIQAVFFYSIQVVFSWDWELRLRQNIYFAFLVMQMLKISGFKESIIIILSTWKGWGHSATYLFENWKTKYTTHSIFVWFFRSEMILGKFMEPQNHTRKLCTQRALSQLWTLKIRGSTNFMYLRSVVRPILKFAKYQGDWIPDRNFHAFRASRSGDRRILSSSEASYDAFWSSKVMKVSFGSLGANEMLLSWLEEHTKKCIWQYATLPVECIYANVKSYLNY